MKQSPTPRHIFIIRLWPSEQPAHQWTGELQNIHTGRIHPIHSIGQLIDHLQATLHPPPAPPPGLR